MIHLAIFHEMDHMTHVGPCIQTLATILLLQSYNMGTVQSVGEKACFHKMDQIGPYGPQFIFDT